MQKRLQNWGIKPLVVLQILPLQTDIWNQLIFGSDSQIYKENALWSIIVFEKNNSFTNTII
jgi:hypothetical protein